MYNIWYAIYSILNGFFFLQFPDTVDFCEQMANNGKTVIVAALDGTFQREVNDIISEFQWRYMQGPHTSIILNYSGFKLVKRISKDFMTNHQELMCPDLWRFKLLNKARMNQSHSVRLCALAGFWRHTAPCSSRGERHQADRGVYAVLWWRFIYKAQGPGDGGMHL